MLVRRNIAWCIVLSFMTCGISMMFWMANITNEFAQENGEEANGWMMVFLSFITCGIYFILWNYKMGYKIQRAGGTNDRILYLILSIFGFGLISIALMQIQENELCIRRIN
jgi:hypothetical protein